MKNRDYSFDNIKAFLIISVLTAHFFRVSGYFEPGSLSRTIYIISFTYIMQGFLFVSGYFSKNVDKCRAGAFKNFIIPYVIFCYLVYFERSIIYGADRCHVWLFEPTFALWFLVVMFAYRFFIKDLAKIPHLIAISIAVYFISAYIPFLDGTMAIGRICGFLIFYVLGYYCQKEHIERIRRIPKWKGIAIVIALVAFCYGSSWLNLPGGMEILLLRAPFASFGFNPLLGLVARLVIAVVALLWIAAFINLAPTRETILTKLGQRTMVVYLLHIFVRNIIKYNGIYGHGNALYYLIVFGLAFVCIVAFSWGPLTTGYNKAIDWIYAMLCKPIDLIKAKLNEKK